MKILHIISSLEIGGAQRLLSDMLPMIAKKHEVTLLINRDVDNDFSRKVKTGGVNVITCECGKPYSPKNIYIIAKCARKFDVIHVHLFPTVYWAAFASFLSPMKLVYTEHSTSNKRRSKWFLRPIERIVYSRYNKIISISQQTQDALVEWLQTKGSDSRFVVINNGVDLSVFQSLKTEKLYPHTLIMVSRFAASKDQMTVIKAMKLLPEDVHVILVGDGETLESCKNFAVEQSLSDRVHFVGRQSDVASWIAKADIGIQSSNWEGFGLTAVEMMAAGKPVVATDVDGLKQVVEGAGVLFPVGDSMTLAAIIQRILYNKEFYSKMTAASKERAAVFDISVTAAQYVKLYHNMVL